MKHSYITIGYLQSKLIRTPLKFHTEWNTKVNDANLDSLKELTLNGATDSEVRKIRLAFEQYLNQ